MTPSRQTTDYLQAILSLSESRLLIEKGNKIIFPTDPIEIITTRGIIMRKPNNSTLSFFDDSWYEVVTHDSDPSVGKITCIINVTKYMANKIGLPTRDTAEELMVSYLQELVTHPQSFALLMIDVDNFKSINDRYGHLVGDAVLKAIARVIKSSIRRTDIIGRYGGDEFFLLLPNIFLENTILKINEIMSRNQGDEEFLLDAPSLPSLPSLSIGVVQISEPEVFQFASFGTNEEYLGLLKTLLTKADEALYLSKESGRDRATIVDISGNVIGLTEMPDTQSAVTYKRRMTDV